LTVSFSTSFAHPQEACKSHFNLIGNDRPHLSEAISGELNGSPNAPLHFLDRVQIYPTISRTISELRDFQFLGGITTWGTSGKVFKKSYD